MKLLSLLQIKSRRNFSKPCALPIMGPLHWGQCWNGEMLLLSENIFVPHLNPRVAVATDEVTFRALEDLGLSSKLDQTNLERDNSVDRQ